MVWNILRKLYKQLKQIHPLCIAVVYVLQIMIFNYCRYAKIKKRYGPDCKVFIFTGHGTGDYYIAGLLLNPWLQKNNVTNYICIVPDGAEKRVAQLFPYVYDRMHVITFYPKLTYPNDKLLTFSGHTVHAHCFCPFVSSVGLVRVSADAYLMGYKNITMLDYFIRNGFNLSDPYKPTQPAFKYDENEIPMHSNTIVLAPYARFIDYQRLNSFWCDLAQALKQKGYNVVTNCAGSEKPIQGTAAIFIPYRVLVPVLNKAAGFIGTRSGLCDIASSATCVKVAVHVYETDSCPTGRSHSFINMQRMWGTPNMHDVDIKTSEYTIEDMHRVSSLFPKEQAE